MEFNDKDIDLLKFYSKVGNMYNELKILSEMFYDTSQGFSDVLNLAFGNNYYLNELDRIWELFNRNILSFDKDKILVENLIEEASVDWDLDLNEMTEIFDLLDESIHFYKEAFETLESYCKSFSQRKFAHYQQNEKLGFERALEACKQSGEGYFDFYLKLQNY